MRPSIFLKTVTLLFFSFCITAFLLYRTGKFDHYFNDDTKSLQTSSNGGTLILSKSDSARLFKPDSLQQLRLSSSKVIILTDKIPRFVDSLKTKRKKDSVISVKPFMLPSSKSGKIITTPILTYDTASMETLLKKPKKTN